MEEYVVENLREEHGKIDVSITITGFSYLPTVSRIPSLCVCVCVCLVQRFDISCVLLPINAASNFKFEF